MKQKYSKPYIILCLYAVAVALLDVAYIIYFAVMMSKAVAGKIVLPKAFSDFSIAIIVINGSLVLFMGLYFLLPKVLPKLMNKKNQKDTNLPNTKEEEKEEEKSTQD